MFTSGINQSYFMQLVYAMAQNEEITYSDYFKQTEENAFIPLRTMSLL